MKIAVFCEDYVKGGQNVFVATLINSWPQDDEFIVVTNADNIGIDLIKRKLHKQCTIIKHDFNFMYREPTKIGYHILRFMMVYGRYIVLYKQLLSIRKLFKEIAPDIVLVSNGGYPGGLTCRAAALTGLYDERWGKPIMIFHNTPIKPRLWEWCLEYYIDYLVEKAVSHLVTVSHNTGGSIINRPALKKSKKLKVIYNGIEEPEITAVDSIIEALKLPQNSRIVLTIGNFEKRKGHEFLINAISHIKKEFHNVHFLLAGNGNIERQKELEKLCKSMKLSDCIHFLGFRDDIASLVYQSEILLVPSQKDESFGLINLEAMVQKKPVVATEVGGIPEVVANDVTGYICKKDNPLEFAIRVIDLLNDKGSCIKFGIAGFERYKKYFTAHIMAENYIKLMGENPRL
jgi:L-malate glycosyltransferase